MVNFQDAFVEEDIFKVKVWVANMSQAFMNVSRDGWALRLSDGRVLRRAIGTFTTHNVYNIPPGGGHEVFVDFRDPGRDMRLIAMASLIVGGISFSTDPASASSVRSRWCPPDRAIDAAPLLAGAAPRL